MRYRITADVTARFRWGGSALEAAARAAFEQFGLREAEPSAGAAQITVKMETGERLPTVPPNAAAVARFDDAQMGAHRAGRHLFLSGAHTLVCLDAAAGWAEARFGPALAADTDALRQSALGTGVMSLLVLVRHHRLFPMHAAALAHPATGAGVLFTARGDSGKSTLAYSLARQGWRYLSDDSVLLRPAAEAVEAVAFRRAFTLDASARRLFPEVAAAWSALPGPEAKGAVAMERLYPDGAAERCVPRLVVFPELAEGQAESTLHPLSRAEAMHGVLSQCALVTLEPERAPAHLDAARRLVAQTRHLRLHAGRDVLENPQRVAALLAEALAQEPPFSARG